MEPTSSDGPPPRRAFLKAGGAAAVAGIAISGAAHPAVAATGGFALDLKRDFGAVGDGRTDDTESVQAAFEELSTTRGGLTGAFLLVPPGEYRISKTIEVSRFAGVIQGAGVGNSPAYQTPGLGSVFRWMGSTDNTGTPMFRITDSRHVAFRDLRFVGDDSFPPSAALNFHNRGRRADMVGTNAELSVVDCHIGVWPWNTDGLYTGAVTNGILFDGTNGNNDKFRIVRTVFRGTRSQPTAGVRLVNTQSVWGSLTDCHFSRLAEGVVTRSSTTLFNAQFMGCGTDITVESTAQVDVFSMSSERSSRMARLGPRAALRVSGGYCQVWPSLMARSGGLISAHPSDNGQTISLTGIRFTWEDRGGEVRPPHRPSIAFGPDGPPTAGFDRHFPAGRRGFLVSVRDCSGLYPEQCELAGRMYASEPRSRGLVEWHTRTHGGIFQFRNELWNGEQPGARSELDTGAWDHPIPGGTD